MSLPGSIGLLSRLPSPASSIFGDVDGPASSTDNAIALFNGTSGKLIKNSTYIMAGAGGTLTVSGSATLNDWFDQSVKSTASPSFGTLAITGAVNVTASADQAQLAIRRTGATNNPGLNIRANETGNEIAYDTIYTSAAPAQVWKTNGTEFMRLGAAGGLSVTGNITGTGVYSTTTASAANVFVDAAGLLQRSTSSIRYKRDVRDYTRGLADVMKLRPVLYKGKAKADGDTDFAGFIAEEVDAAGLTEFVVYNDVLSDTETVPVLQPDGKIVEKPKVIATHQPDALAYANMVALLTKAVQELKADNDALAARVAALEAK